MATVYIPFDPREGIPAASNGAAHDALAGTNFPIPVLAFDDDTEESAFFYFRAASYGSGNLTLTVDWYADTASSGDVIWGAALAAITPNTDTTDIEDKAFDTAQTATDSHLGTTGQRLHTVDVTISNLDSLAAGDWCCLKVYRDADAVGDTLSGDAFIARLQLSYSDT